MRFPNYRLACVLMFPILVLGCGQRAQVEAAEPAVPDTPDGTVAFVAHNLVEHRPQAVWMALPESYQKDINEITKAFAEKMDPEVYDKTMALSLRAVNVLKEKMALILESTTFQSTQVDPAEVDMALDPSFAVAETLLTSQISTLAGLRTIDWEQFLATTGASLLEQAAAIKMEDDEDPIGELATLEVEVLTATDDKATLKLKTANEEPEVVEMVRIEGRWVPADLAEEWPEMMANARQHLDEMTPENVTAMKTQAMMGLGMAEGLIDQIASIETAEEFDAAVAPLVQGLMGSIGLGEDVSGDDTGDEMEDE